MTVEQIHEPATKTRLWIPHRREVDTTTSKQKIAATFWIKIVEQENGDKGKRPPAYGKRDWCSGRVRSVDTELLRCQAQYWLC